MRGDEKLTAFLELEANGPIAMQLPGVCHGALPWLIFGLVRCHMLCPLRLSSPCVARLIFSLYPNLI